MIRLALILLWLGAGATETARPLAPAFSVDLDQGCSLGFIPLASPAAARDLGLYLEGFFRDDAGRGAVAVPPKARRLADHLADYRAAGATHLAFVYHEGEAEAEHLRILLLGGFAEEAIVRLEAAGLGRRGAPGSFELLAFKDDVVTVGSAPLPVLPIGRLVAWAGQVAGTSSGSVDLVDLTRQDATESYLEALREAFAEEGQSPDKAEVPARALQVAAAIPRLRDQGARQLVVIAHQNAKGADIILLQVRGVFTPAAQVTLRTMFAPLALDDSTMFLQRWVDGEEKSAAPGGVEPRRHPLKK